MIPNTKEVNWKVLCPLKYRIALGTILLAIYCSLGPYLFSVNGYRFVSSGEVRDLIFGNYCLHRIGCGGGERLGI